jgi:hypothetical protein
MNDSPQTTRDLHMVIYVCLQAAKLSFLSLLVLELLIERAFALLLMRHRSRID